MEIFHSKNERDPSRRTFKLFKPFQKLKTFLDSNV
jgi:hypothetical protein